MKTQTHNKKYTDFGNVKRTNNQIKKHCTMFTDKEELILSTVLKGMSVTVSSHAKRKNIARSGHTKNALQSFDIIEFNHTNDDSRCLLRGRAVECLEDNREYSLCIVVSLSRAEIVTVYYNESNDLHSHVDMKRYSDFSILDYL